MQPITRCKSELSPQLRGYDKPPLLPKHHCGIHNQIVPRVAKMCHRLRLCSLGNGTARHDPVAAELGIEVQRTQERALDFNASCRRPVGPPPTAAGQWGRHQLPPASGTATNCRVLRGSWDFCG